MEITKILEFDMGHRVPNHKSKCLNPHGHRYKCEITMVGDVVQEKGSSDEGMVIDFSDVKEIAKGFIDTQLDHGFMFYEGDTQMTFFFDKFKTFKYIRVAFIPTAENIAKFIFENLAPIYQDKYGTGLKLKRIRLYETPNSYADYEL